MKYSQKNRFSQMTLALSLLIGTFSLFSIAFGLQKNYSFPISHQENPTIQETRVTTTEQADFIAFQEFSEDPDRDPEYILQHLEQLGSIGAQSFLIGDLDTGEIIFERKPESVYAIASVTKFMTALTAIETLEPNEVALITQKKVEVPGGNRARFKIGDTLTIRELIYPLLLVSANDAGEIIAQQRDREVFMQNMNQYAKKLGMEQTHFDDPTGLSDKNTSTARDLFIMMRSIKDDYPEIIEVSKLNLKRISHYFWQNINKAANIPGFAGGKTGFTNAAKYTSIGYYKIKLANDQVRNIGIVILQSNTRESDTQRIINYLTRYVAYL